MPIRDPAADQPVSDMELQVARRLVAVALELCRRGELAELIDALADRAARRLQRKEDADADG